MSSKSALKSLFLSSFRGSSTAFTLEFEKNRKLTLIYGENGTGKTTICDALEFLAEERIGSLEDRGLGKGLTKFWPTAGKAPNQLSVKLETASGVCSGAISGKKIVITPTTAKPRIELLRRQQILRLIEAQPASRYEEIKRFIDIAAFEQSEEALRKLGKSLQTEKAEARGLEDESLATLKGFFDSDIKPAGQNPVSWAKQKLAGPEDALDADIAAIGKLRTAYVALAAFPERLAECLASIAKAKADFDQASEALTIAITQAGDGAADELALLNAGQAYLHAHPDEAECPLCGSAEKAANLATAIASRLAKLGALRSAASDKNARQAALDKAEAVLARLNEDYTKAASKFADAIKGHAWRSEVTLPPHDAPEKIAGVSDWISKSASASAIWPNLESAWRGEVKFLAALKAAVGQYESNLKRRMDLEQQMPRVDSALKICVSSRKAFTDGIIKEIAEEVGKLYEIVHPGEGLNSISLPLDPQKRASLELNAKFGNEDAPPQAYFSQSHLDTLGLCVFLALALRDRPEEKILILDDVLGSVDEPHVERIIHMIYEVSAKFRHTIVTTHYRPWREKYRWGWLKANQPCQFVELTGWGMDDGIRIVSSLPEIERLKVLLAATPIDVQSVCSKAGVILEAALDYLTQKYECAVPRRSSGAYTIGDLLQSINGKMRDALSVEIRDGAAGAEASPLDTVALKPILDEVQRIAQVRNAFGAHFKAISFELLDTDAIGFAKQVVALMDALTHPEHGWPTNDKSGSYWRNSGDTRRLHPLRRPS